MQRHVALVLMASLTLVAPVWAQHGTTADRRPPANQGRIPREPPRRKRPDTSPEIERSKDGTPDRTPHVNHNHWYGHDAPSDVRYHLDRPFPHGRFLQVGRQYRYSIVRFDPGQHWFWFPGGFAFEVAAWDWPICADWCWTCTNDFIVFNDSDHAGWYVLYNVRTGRYVHVQYMGIV